MNPPLKRLSPAALLAGLTLALASLPAAQAAVIVTLPSSSAEGSIVITQDISFRITTSGTMVAFLFDEWVTSDRENDIYWLYDPQQSLDYTLNGGSPTATPLSSFRDNIAVFGGAMTPNDGYLLLNTKVGVGVSVDDVLTLKAQTWMLPAGTLPAGFNSQANQTFTGSMYLTDVDGGRLSANTPVGAVPEPGTTLLGALAGLTLLRRRRR